VFCWLALKSAQAGCLFCYRFTGNFEAFALNQPLCSSDNEESFYEEDFVCEIGFGEPDPSIDLVQPSLTMKLTTNRKLAAGNGLAFLLIGTIGWQVYHSIHEQSLAARWAAHSQTVLARLMGLQSRSTVVEACGRNYLRTGQLENLQQAAAAAAAVATEAQAIRQLVPGGAVQPNQWTSLELTAQDCAALAQHALNLAKNREAGQARELLQSNGRRVLRSRLDQLIGEAGSHEARSMHWWTARSSREASKAKAWLVLGGFVIVTAIGGMGWRLRRSQQLRHEAEGALNRAHNEFEQRVAERTVEINNANVALHAEIAERQRIEEALCLAHGDLETRVEQRTTELGQANEELQREIAERQRIGEALKNSRALYHSLVENLPVSVWRTDLEGRFTFGNQHLCDCLGVAQEDFLGRTFFDFFTTAAAEKFADDDRRVLETREALEDIEEFAMLAGKTGYQQTLKTPCYDADGQLVGVQGISWDVTERKQAEQERQEIQAQLEQVNRDLSSKHEEIQNFYHTLSHELKTPLTSAREFVSIVMDGLAGPLNETQHNYLDIARESCNQIRVCLNDLLDATRLETGKLSIERKPASLGALAERVVTAMQPAAVEKKITLSAHIDPDLPEVPLDENRILQVINNLLANALKFTSEGGSVTVGVAETPDQPEFLQVSVSDTGRGIAREELDRIFDRLYQVKTGDGATGQGVGLGLYLCRELVSLHGGGIQVQSEPGKGSIFRFCLPKTPSLPRRKLLLVDDDAELRDIFRQLLERADFTVATADGGHTALELMQQQTPDVVVLDLAMADLDGAATLKEIRHRWGLVPVILHTGHPESELMQQAGESRPFTLLTKPCAPQDLISTARELAGSTTTASLADGQDHSRLTD